MNERKTYLKFVQVLSSSVVAKVLCISHACAVIEKRFVYLLISCKYRFHDNDKVDSCRVYFTFFATVYWIDVFIRKDAMRKNYTFFNDVPDLHCEIKQRIIQGNIIIEKESIIGFGLKPMEAKAIYHIDGDKIKKGYFIQ